MAPYIFVFPHLEKFDGCSMGACMHKILEEAGEAGEEILESHGKPTREFILEVMDVMQACETTLRNSGLTYSELDALFQEHNAKDAARGYQEKEAG